MNTTKLRKSDYIFLFIVFVGFYLLYRFSLLTSDDYYYSFIGGISGGINGQYIPVDSFADAIKSNIHDYINWNGRFIIHTITSYFCGAGNIDFFRVINSIIFVLLIAGLIKLIRSEFGYNKTDKYIILFLLFIFMPVPGYIFLGHIAFVTNYLWTSCAIIYFILLYNKIKENNDCNIWKGILLLLAGVVIGSLQESFTISISGALFIYYCCHLNKFRGSVAWLVIGFWIGTCIVFLSPGNFIRLFSDTSTSKEIDILKVIQSYIYIILDFKFLLIVIFLLVVLYFKNKIFLTNFLKENSFYFLSILFNCIIVAIVYTGKRQLTCIELFSMILLIKMIYRYFFIICENKGKIINAVISFILIFLYIPIYEDRQKNHLNYIELQNTKPENGIIVDNDIYNKSIKSRALTSNHTFYSLDECNDDFFKQGLSLFKSNGKNINYITAILPLTPKEIKNKFNNVCSEYVYDEKNMIYYFRCHKDQTIKHIYMHSAPFSFQGKIRLFLKKEKFKKTDIFNSLLKFQYNNYNYYLYYNAFGHKIYDFKIEYK